MKLRIYLMPLSFKELNKKEIFEKIARETKRILQGNNIDSDFVIIEKKVRFPRKCKIKIYDPTPAGKYYVLNGECTRSFVDNLKFEGQKVAITSEYLRRPGIRLQTSGVSCPGKTSVVVSWLSLSREAKNIEVIIKRCANTIVHEIVHNLGVREHHENCIMQAVIENPKEIDEQTETICEDCRKIMGI